ncbi:clavesin-1-like isoform X2 [Lycorma delicatula]|uniref:clavesin-1-like isoform X2 n=1 Tax=Lycorma delicatula TaxID=130591 RepID=UPI003F514FE3
MLGYQNLSSMGHGYEPDDNDYENLSEELRLIAQTELREDDSSRRHALEQMREWIHKHPDIIYCRTDGPFLLRFLRTKKFCIPLAQEMLEKYLIIRQLYPQWFHVLDVDDPAISDILDSGYLVPLPERDDDGRKVILSCAGKFDPYKHSSTEMARVHSLVVESLMDDPENQIRGYTYVNDESGLTMGHISLWSFSDIRNMLRCIQNSTPMRHKSTHFVNVPSCANKVFEFITSLLNDKLRKRFMIHNTTDDLKKAINPRILPKEYGGEIPLADMIDNYKKELKQKKQLLLALDDLKIDVNRKTKFFKEMEDQQLTGIAGSFRKLEVD